MHTWTNQPYETMWNHLLVFNCKANVKKLLNGALHSARSPHGNWDEKLLERKSAQVAYCISQAHEYFKAADTVTIHTSPLLYFYGMLSLAKALIVAKHPDKLLDDIAYHGLQRKPWQKHSDLQSYVNDKSKWCMEKEYAITNDGVFKELTLLIHGFCFPDGDVTRYKDLLANKHKI